MASQHDRLTQALIELLRSERELDEDVVRRAMARALRALERERSEREPPPRRRAATVAVERPTAVDGCWAQKTDSGWIVVMEVRSRAHFLRLGSELHVGIDVKLEMPPPFDSDVDLCLFVPALGDELWFRGRVVSRGAQRVRLEVEPATRDHPQRWNRVSALFSTSEQPAVPAGTKTAPDIQPPRLAARSRRSSHSMSSKPAKSARSGAHAKLTRSQGSQTIRRRRSSSEELADPKRDAARSRSSQAAPSTRESVRGPASTRSGKQPARPRTRQPSQRQPSAETREHLAVGAPRPRAGDAARYSTVNSRPARRSAAGRTGEHLPVSRPAPAVPEVERPKPSLAKLLVLLRNKCARIGHADHFTMLGLHWSAHQGEVDAAFAEETWLLDRARYPAAFNPVDDLERHRLLKALEEAYAAIGDPSARQRYRTAMHDANEITATIKVYLDKAEMAFFRRQSGEARDPLLRVIELDPGNTQAKERLSEIGIRV